MIQQHTLLPLKLTSQGPNLHHMLNLIWFQSLICKSCMVTWVDVGCPIVIPHKLNIFFSACPYIVRENTIPPQIATNMPCSLHVQGSAYAPNHIHVHHDIHTHVLKFIRIVSRAIWFVTDFGSMSHHHHHLKDINPTITPLRPYYSPKFSSVMTPYSKTTSI